MSIIYNVKMSQTLVEENLQTDLANCLFGKKQTELLGHKINQPRLAPKENKTASIQTTSQRTNNLKS